MSEVPLYPPASGLTEKLINETGGFSRSSCASCTILGGSAVSIECGYLGSKGIYGRKVMRTPLEIHLGLRSRST